MRVVTNVGVAVQNCIATKISVPSTHVPDSLDLLCEGFSLTASPETIKEKFPIIKENTHQCTVPTKTP